MTPHPPVAPNFGPLDSRLRPQLRYAPLRASPSVAGAKIGGQPIQVRTESLNNHS